MESVWKCKHCSTKTKESDLKLVEYKSSLSNKTYKEVACPNCGSLDVEPTKEVVRE